MLIEAVLYCLLAKNPTPFYQEPIVVFVTSEKTQNGTKFIQYQYSLESSTTWVGINDSAYYEEIPCHLAEDVVREQSK